MARFARKPPWYAAGLAFECLQCGDCCAGPEEGYVWITDKEIAAVAAYLRMSEQEFRRRFVRRVGRRQSLIEKKPSHDCIFLVPNGDGAGQGCEIYPVRPVQCRTWPFWTQNLGDPTDWAMAQVRCPGINRGSLFTREQIEARRDVTRE
jgi:Fe-S-cluster containining protein